MKMRRQTSGNKSHNGRTLGSENGVLSSSEDLQCVTEEEGVGEEKEGRGSGGKQEGEEGGGGGGKKLDETDARRRKRSSEERGDRGKRYLPRSPPPLPSVPLPPHSPRV
eukprot:754656-Hanusia_phi.AAC.2